jgi:RND family efflux transporter MFP subunit
MSKTKHSSILPTLLCLVCLALFSAAASVSDAVAQARAAPVAVDKVRAEALAQTMPVIGRFVARESGIVATRIAERVRTTPVQVGDRVKKGAVLAKLSDDRLIGARKRLAAERRRAAAKIDRSRTTMAKFDQNLRRVSALKNSNAYRQDRQDDAERDLEASASALAEAEAEHARVEADFSLAEIAIRDATIRAPYAGVVTDRHTVAGNYVRVGDPIVTLLNDTDLEIEADVPDNRVSGLMEGVAITAGLQGGQRIKATVRAVVPDENPRTRTRAVRFVPQFPDGQSQIARNQSVTVLIPIGTTRDVVTVHKDAVVVKKGKQLVYVVTDGKAGIRPVVVGESVGGRFEIKKGLKPGDVVVIRGNERLRPDQAVKISGAS